MVGRRSLYEHSLEILQAQKNSIQQQLSACQSAEETEQLIKQLENVDYIIELTEMNHHMRGIQ
ncbi:MAG: DUF3896 family protein [Bacilli bacterium]